MPDVPVVLHLCSIKGRGGTGWMTSRLCRMLRDEGVRVVVGACAGSKVEERAREAGLETLDGLRLRRGFHPADLRNDVSRIRRFVADESVDILHAWHSIEYWTAAAACLGRKTLLVRTRGLVTPVGGGPVNRLIHGRTAFVHVTCERVRENYEAAGLDGARVELVPDGVDLERFRPDLDGSRIRAEADIPDDAAVVASVARLEPVKGHVHLLDAFAADELRESGASLLLAGDGSQREMLETKAAELGISERVRFLGVRSDIPDVLAAADVFVLSSIGSEGSSRATLEAMASGLPVVAASVGVLPDMVTDETGALVPPADPSALADALTPFVADAELRRNAGAAARRVAEERFDERLFARRMADLYKKVLAERDGGGAQ